MNEEQKIDKPTKKAWNIGKNIAEGQELELHIFKTSTNEQ